MRPGYHPRVGGSSEKDEDSLKKQGFYHKTAWRRVRLLALQRDHYLCQLRISKKCTGIATEVHHIKPLEDFPELGLELSNLTSCCWFCHEETKPRSSERVEPPVKIIHIRDGSEFEEMAEWTRRGRKPEN